MTHAKLPTHEKIYLEGDRKQVLETARNRLLVTGVMFMIAFCAIGIRLVDLSAFASGSEPRISRTVLPSDVVSGRADIIDRNGVILATSLPTSSLYADPQDVLNPEDAAEKLARVLPEINAAELLLKLRSKSRFVWISRNLTPKQKYAVNRLGLPGFAFQTSEKRVYPHGREAAHILGLTDVDGKGIAGVEKQFADSLEGGIEPLQLSIDVRIQTMLRQELMASVSEFKALGAAGLVMDVESGEVLGMVSLPDFDPNSPATMRGEAGFNRVAKGVYEMGSTFKLFTAAMALDSGSVHIDGGYDASEPLRAARYMIRDYHAKNRWLSVPEILVYSSNIGAAKMALDVGTEGQKFYLERLGLLSASNIELPEVGHPLVPDRWGDISTMTISYGHGVSVSPLQLAGGVSTLVNGGIHRPVSLLKYRGPEAPAGERVLSAETSEKMRGLMRLVVQRGTGRNAASPGYLVGGKTGTAEKQKGGRYEKKSLISSFVGAFPIDNPRYVVLAIIDEPKGNKRTFNYATGGWVAAPVVGRMISRMAPMLGMAPRNVDEEDAQTARFRMTSLKKRADASGSRQLASY